MPDTIAGFTAADGNFYLLTANEGDARDYTGCAEERRVADVRLDPALYPYAAELQDPVNMGRLRITAADGDTDGEMVWNSQSHLEVINSLAYPDFFNVSNADNIPDGRSDDKGPEPEAVTTGVIRGRTYAFIANERQSNIVIYDVTNPRAPLYVGQHGNRNYTVPTNTAGAGDLGPEGVIFVPADQSPNRQPLLIVANEISGTVTIWQVN